jgi:hypothetical protein
MDAATMGSYREMSSVAKLVLNTKTFCLKIRPKIDGKNWVLKVFCDIELEGDSETRISVTGFIVCLQITLEISLTFIQDLGYLFTLSIRDILLISSHSVYCKLLVQVLFINSHLCPLKRQLPNI